MKNRTFKIVTKILFSFVIVILLSFRGEGTGLSPVNGDMSQEQEAKKARLYKDVFPLISETDLYCSFFVMKKPQLDIQIVGAEKQDERVLFRENDIFFVNKGSADGLETGQIFTIVEVGEKVRSPFTGKNYGRLIKKRGRAQIVSVEEKQAFAKLEKACEQVTLGQFLVPFEEKSELLGSDLGYDVDINEEEGTQGTLIYFQDDYGQISKGHWAIIDLGEEDGIHFGQQLVIYRKTEKKKGTIKKLGSLIVIDVQENSSTVKILSTIDALTLGDRVQPRY
jgi:hypothetical protein